MSHGTLPYLQEILLFLILAGVLIPLLQRLKINQVLGFLAVGMLLGPFGLGGKVENHSWLGYITFTRIDGVIALGEFGLLFLMFRIGLELSMERLWQMRRWVFGAGSLQLLSTAFLLGLIVYQFNHTLEISFILGMVFAFSSTAIVIQLLVEERLLASSMGRRCFAILLFQDLAVVPLLVLIKALSDNLEKSEFFMVLLFALIKAIIVIVLIYGVGRIVVRPVFRYFAKLHQSDVFMALILLSTLSVSALTLWAGLSMALGAFLVGLLLSETEYRHEIEATIDPFKGLLIGLFFMAVGLGMDLEPLLEQPFWLLASIVGLLLIKSMVVTFIFRLGNFSWRSSIESGCLLAQGGEFAFIIIAAAILNGILENEMGQFMLLVTGGSMLVAPLYAKLGSIIKSKLTPSITTDLSRNIPLQLFDQHIILAGFGQIGQTIAQLLHSQNIPYVAIDNNPEIVERFYGNGFPVYFGDASKLALLQQMQVKYATAVVLTMDNRHSAANAVSMIQREYPNVKILARTHDEHQALAFKTAGVDATIPETFGVSLELVEKILKLMGFPEDLIDSVITKSKDTLFGKLEILTVAEKIK